MFRKNLIQKQILDIIMLVFDFVIYYTMHASWIGAIWTFYVVYGVLLGYTILSILIDFKAFNLLESAFKNQRYLCNLYEFVCKKYGRDPNSEESDFKAELKRFEQNTKEKNNDEQKN